jgi:3-mercaptopyruvate sulfurtransferase SseA
MRRMWSKLFPWVLLCTCLPAQNREELRNRMVVSTGWLEERLRGPELVLIDARTLGYEPKLYDGSFQDWSKRGEMMVEKEPRSGW